MGITKVEGFEIITTQMADTLKVLGHPARLSIIKYLSETDSCVSGDLEDIIPLAQPTISRHLSELKRVNLIKGSISGKTICYCINNTTWRNVEEYLFNISESIKAPKKCPQ